MIKRTNEFWTVAFFLSKFYEVNNEQEGLPPRELETERWNEAYRSFFNSISNGRTLTAFERSLKNARDAFDSHLKESQRVGWFSKDGKPNQLSKEAKNIFATYNNFDRADLWNVVRRLRYVGGTSPSQHQEDLDVLKRQYKEETVESQTEGGVKVAVSTKYERRPSLRNSAFKIHGYDCAVCGFNYGRTYGEWGENFAEVHHLVPLHRSKGKRRKVDPNTDLIILCANCHRMVHRKKSLTLTVEELKNKMKLKK